MALTFGYDALHRLTHASGPWGTGTGCSGATYTYDSNGNRLCNGDGNPATYGYSTGTNRVSSANHGGGQVTSYTHDSVGNITVAQDQEGPPVNFNYDRQGRLASVDDGFGIGDTFVYDGFGRRVAKTGGVTRYFFYDAEGKLLTETAAGGGSGKDYTYLEGEPLARVDWVMTETPLAGDPMTADAVGADIHLVWTQDTSGASQYVVRRKQVTNPAEKSFSGGTVLAVQGATEKTYVDRDALSDLNRYDYKVFQKAALSESLYFYHTDHLGTPILMTDATGAPAWRAEYRPFGDVLTFPATDIENNLRFPGQYFDLESGLYQNWFRDYDPSLGRYREPDPIGVTDGNLFAYARNNTIYFVDPWGLLTAEQCERVGIVLQREQQFGTRKAASMSSITFGDKTIGPFNSDFAPPIQTPSGPIELDWFTDIRAKSPTPLLSLHAYVFGKLAWTGIRLWVGDPITNYLPGQDLGEVNAAGAALKGWKYSDIFTPEYLSRECPATCGTPDNSGATR